MNRIITKAVIFIGCCLIAGGNTRAVELVIPPDVSTALNRELGRSYNKYQLSNKQAGDIHSQFQSWVSETINFDAAETRKSDRFGGRVTYYQERDDNLALYVYHKPSQTPLPTNGPLPVIYRVAPNRFSFRKLLDVEATEEVDDGYAVEIVGSFLTSGGFLRTTALDKYETSFRRLRQKHAPHEDLPERDVLIFQQARYRRKFLNAIVVNSRISVDFHPDNLEILGFKHYNWTPANEDSPVYIPPQEKKSRSEVEEALEQQMREFWSESQRATLTSVEQMWWQTETELIPMLYCMLEREETGCGDVCAAMINIAGSDLVFYASPRIPAEPPLASDCFPSTNPAYADWRAYGSPSCWCRPYQCDGDADGQTEGILRYRVALNDLNMIIANWKKRMDDEPDPCADIDHKAEGLLKYRVALNDLNIVIANWKKTDRNLPGNCPRPD